MIFNTVIPGELGYINRIMDRKGLKALIAQCYRELGPAATTSLVDGIKTLGFHYATRGRHHHRHRRHPRAEGEGRPARRGRLPR